MNNRELISEISRRTDMTAKQVSELLATTIAEINRSLLDGDTIHLKDFGDFEVRHRASRLSVHPKTGERTMVPEKLQLVFKQASSLKDKLNTNGISN